MTDLRTAATMALEALDGLSEDAVCQSSHHAKKDQHTSLDVCPVFLRLRAAITALRAALAEPVQEPVAWRWGYRSVTTGEMDWRGYVEIAAHPNLRSPAIIMQPLYTAPHQRKPLTEEEIRDLWSWAMTAEAERTATTQQHAFARAIERAHGITS